MIKLGNISFNEAVASEMSFEDFETFYRGKLRGYDLVKAYKELTGRSPSYSKTDGETKGTANKTAKVRQRKTTKRATGKSKD